MKLLLVNPSRGKNAKGDFWDFKFEKRVLNQTSLIPLSLPTIAAATPEDVETVIIDEKVDDINLDEHFDLVGIGAMTPNITRAYEIADEFRERGVKVVFGGIHASMLPEEASEHADGVVIGEADYVWSDVINDFKEGNLKSTYQFTRYPDIEKIPAPRYDLVNPERYVIDQVQTARGCPFDCEFCSVKAFSGKEFRFKNVEQVIREIETLSPYYEMNAFGHKLKLPKTLLFADDNIVGNKSYARKLFNALIPLKLNDWYCQSSINVGRDKEMLALMKEAGCHAMIIGIESVVEDSLIGMDKRINKVDKYYECINNIQSAGIKVFGSFVLGNDSEDDAIFEKTVEFIKDNNLIYNAINILTPLPGTKLYKRFEKEGRLLHKDWERYDLETVCFQPKQMSVKALEEGRCWVCQQIYSLEPIHERYENFLKQKNNKEVRGFEDSWKETSFTDKFYSWLMMTKILYKINGEQRRFLLNMLRRYFEGKETNFGNTIASISFNEYANNLTLDTDESIKVN